MEKIFFQNSDKLQKNIILSLFKIDTFNFNVYILTILTCPLKHML